MQSLMRHTWWKAWPSVRYRRSSTLLHVVRILVFGLAGGLAACSNIEPVPPDQGPITDPTQLYVGLTLDRRAITLSTDTSAAKYYRLQLRAVPRDALGNVMEGLPAPTFQSHDTTRVRVTADGMLTAVGATTGSGIMVVATLTAGPLTHADTAIVVVQALPNPPRPASLSIDPIPPDSATWPLFTGGFGAAVFYYAGLAPDESGGRSLSPMVVDSAGNPITGLQVAYASLDSLTATVGKSGAVSRLRPGLARLVARATAYGVDLVDTTTITVTMPTSQDIVFATQDGVPGFHSILPGRSGSSEVRIAPYGMVFWLSQDPDADSVDVIFDDPTHVGGPPTVICQTLADFGFPPDVCGEGNLVIPEIPGGNINLFFLTMRIRQFPTPGIYPYHSRRTGASGRVVVTNDPS